MIVKNIEYHLEEALKDVKTLQARNKDLRETNDKLLSEHYKDEELQRLKEELEKAKERNRHYGLSKNNWDKLHNFWLTHKCRHEGMKRKNYEIVFGGDGAIDFATLICSCGVDHTVYY